MPATGSSTSSSVTSISSRPESSPAPGAALPRPCAYGHGRGSGRASGDGGRRARRSRRSGWPGSGWAWFRCWLPLFWALPAAARGRPAAVLLRALRALLLSCWPLACWRFACRSPRAVLPWARSSSSPCGAPAPRPARRERRSPGHPSDGVRGAGGPVVEGGGAVRGRELGVQRGLQAGERVAARGRERGAPAGGPGLRRFRQVEAAAPRRAVHGRGAWGRISDNKATMRSARRGSRACGRPPPRASEMAWTRSPLRILDVPLTPSSDAIACSSGRRSAEIPALRADPPEVLTAGSMMSVTKDPSPRRWPGPGGTGIGRRPVTVTETVLEPHTRSVRRRLRTVGWIVTGSSSHSEAARSLSDAGHRRTRSGERIDAITVGSRHPPG